MFRWQSRIAPSMFLLLVGLSLATGCLAQSIDYRGFERLFDEPVTISATGKPERISDTPVTMDIITAADIKRSGARDLASLLRSLPGIVTYRSANGSEIFNMGALLLNGREVYLAGFEESFLAALPVQLSEIRQIEFARGPQSALYGFNSSDGVVNIITFDPAQDPINLVQLRAGNDARRDVSLIASAEIAPGFGARLAASSAHAHDRGEESAAMIPDNPDDRSLSATFSLIRPDGERAGLEISHSDSSLRAILPQSFQFYDARLQTDAIKADYGAETAIGRLSALFSFTALTVPEGATFSIGWFALHDRTSDGRINDLIKWGPDDTLRLEFEVRDEAIHTSETESSINSFLIAPSLMWEHQFSPDLSLVNAVRYYHTTTAQATIPTDNNSYTHVNHGIADNSSLIYKFDSDDSWRLSFARGVSLPSQLALAQLGLATRNGTTSLGQDPNLSSAYVSETRTSWDHHFADESAALRLSLFREQSMNLIGLLPVQLLADLSPICAHPTGPILQYCHTLETTSGLGGTVEGAEFELTHRSAIGPQWGVNYTLETLHPHSSGAAAQLVNGIQKQEWFHKVNANAGYGWQDWSFDLRLNYSSPVEGLLIQAGPPTRALLASDKPTLTLAPHLSWAAREDLVVDLAADNLWQTEATYLTRLPITYFLTVNWSY